MKKLSSPTDLAAQLAAAQQKLAEAEHEFATIAVGEAAAALGGIETLRAWRSKRTDAEDVLAAARAQIEEIARRHSAAEAKEAEALRVNRYAETAADLDRVVVDTLALAETTRRDIAAMHVRARQLQANITRANADRPAGKPPIVDVERDPRLAAGKLIESTGLIAVPRPVTVFDREFFVLEAPAKAAVMLPKKPVPPPAEDDLANDTGALKVVTVPGKIEDRQGERGTCALRVFRTG